MPRIVAAATALPSHSVSQEEVGHTAARIFAGRLPELHRLLRVFDHSRIERRQFMRPLAWYLVPHTPAERNRVYLEDGMVLLARAARKCLQRAGVTSEAVDHVICVSSTGHATPSLDARLINELGLPRSATRLPVWGLGCAGGAAGLARAFDYCRAHPEALALITTLECCSLTFLAGDVSKKNMVATAIFADGAAAALVAGSEIGGEGPRIRATRSHLFPDSYRVMGWDFGDEGMELVLSPKLPAIVKQELPPLVDGFLQEQGLAREDLTHYITHPGGAKVIDAYRQALNLSDDDLALTEAMLRNHGNVSSASVLYVLEQWFASGGSQQPGHGLLSAFGPGFSAEMLLLEV
jgi:alkylresorcinol/alkylpyrone synthase